MDFYIAAGIDTRLPRCFTVSLVGIGNMKREVELAGILLRIDHINPFRSLVVSLPGFRSNWVSSKRHFIASYHLAAVHEIHYVFSLKHDDLVCDN